MQSGKNAQAIWQKNEPYIKRICEYKLSSHPEEAEDALQETALAFFEAVKNGKEIAEPEKWLTVVAVNKINGIYRKIGYDKKHTVSTEDEAYINLTAEEEMPALPEKVLLKYKKEFLSTLSDDELQLYKLRFIKRMKIKDIAVKTGKTEVNIKQKIFRLKRKAKKYIAEQFEENA